MLIASDIDDVLLDLIPAIIEFHNRRYGTNLTKEEFHSYSVGEVFGCSNWEAIRRMHKFFETEEFRDVKPVEGAVEGVTALRDRGVDFVALTSRLSFSREITEENIERYFPNIFTGRIYLAVNYYLRKFSSPKSKGAYCVELKADVMIDDSIAHAKECRDLGVRVLLMDSPHNRREEPEGIVRVKNWQEIMEYFK